MKKLLFILLVALLATMVLVLVTYKEDKSDCEVTNIEMNDVSVIATETQPEDDIVIRSEENNEETFTIDNLKYEIIDVEKYEVSVSAAETKPEGDILIPSTVENGGVSYTVRTIADYAFYYCEGLTTVTIPTTILSIGKHAFQVCTSLISATIPNSVVSIGDYAFFNCYNLTTVFISESVNCIGEQAFDGCYSLTEIKVASDNPHFSIDDGVLFNRDKTTLFYCFAGKTGSYEIPNSVTTIGDYAFLLYGNNKSLTSIIIPNSVKSIGKSAFRGCVGLVSVNIPSSVNRIGEGAFFGCVNAIINCEVASKPDGWDDNWNQKSTEDEYYEGGKVVWGSKSDQ